MLRTAFVLASTLVAVCSQSKIDPDTPSCELETFDDGNTGQVKYIMKFSDEFEKEGRRFGAGEDERWTAINSHNDGTADIEGYNEHSATTAGGKLHIKVTNDSIVLDPSGTPRIYNSAMLQTWNKTCFRGGILEVKLQLPGDHNKPGMWPAAWMLGNLGRVGFGKDVFTTWEVDGQGAMWPYSYDTCLPHSYPYYMPPNTYQRYDACNASEIPGYCDTSGYSTIDCETIMANKKLLQGSVLHGRGSPELDLLEVTVNDFTSKDYEATLSTSLQIGPVTGGNEWINGKGTCYDQVFSNLSVGAGGSAIGNSQLNPWHGAYGAEVISALTVMPPAPFYEEYVYRMEWKLSDNETMHGGLTWYVKRGNETNFQFLFDIDQKALAGCGDVGSEYRTEDRPVPQEPMYMLLNVALANDFSPVPTHDATFRSGFPYEMAVDYVRFFQKFDAPDEDSVCDSDEYPTAAFIDANSGMYSNPNITAMKITYNESLCNGTGNVNITAMNITGAYPWFSYYDERCPTFGQIIPGGCYNKYLAQGHKDLSEACRQCYLRSTFEELAFTEAGNYGDSTSGQVKTTGFIANPICPPFVCKAKGFPVSECAIETLPGIKSCSNLSLHMNSTDENGTVTKNSQERLSVKYCSNGMFNDQLE